MSLNIKLLIILFCGCSFFNAQKSQSDIKNMDTAEVYQKIAGLISSRPDFFYSKIQAKISATQPDFDGEVRFSTRVKKDSLIFSNVNYLGIQAATIYVTQNKGAILNRFNKCYVEGDAKVVSDMIGVELELLELEELILGLPIFYTKLDRGQLVTQSDSTDNILVTFSGNIRTDSIHQKLVGIKYIFDNSLTYLKQMEITSTTDSLSLVWKCTEFQEVSNYRMPLLVDVTITKLDSMVELNLKYNSVEINVPEVIEFEIPENYEKCK
jgi:hypothetical protein